MQRTRLATREKQAVAHKPVLDVSSGVLAAAHADHNDGEEEEEAGHGEAHAVHGLVAHDDVTIHMVLHAGNTEAALTETWNLTESQHRRENTINIIPSTSF